MNRLVTVLPFALLLPNCQRNGEVPEEHQASLELGLLAENATANITWMNNQLEVAVDSRCSGVLVAENLVLTAAHCVWSRDPALTAVSFGAAFPEDWSEYQANAYRVEAIYVPWDDIVPGVDKPHGYEYFSSNSNLSQVLDIAVIRLHSPVLGVTPAKFVSAAIGASYLGKTVTLAGIASGGTKGVRTVLNATLTSTADSFLWHTNLVSAEGGSFMGSPLFIDRNGAPYVAGIYSYRFAQSSAHPKTGVHRKVDQALVDSLISRAKNEPQEGDRRAALDAFVAEECSPNDSSYVGVLSSPGAVRNVKVALPDNHESNTGAAATYFAEAGQHSVKLSLTARGLSGAAEGAVPARLRVEYRPELPTKYGQTWATVAEVKTNQITASKNLDLEFGGGPGYYRFIVETTDLITFTGLDYALCVGTGDDASPPAGCEGSCGAQSADGCYCDEDCVGNGDCCDDYQVTCQAEPPAPQSDCIVSGCNGENCAPMYLPSTCEWTGEASCYATAECGHFGPAGGCAWKQTPELTACLENTGEY